MTRVDFRPMGGRSGYVWLYGTAAVGAAVFGYFLLTDFEVAYALFGLLFFGFFAYLIVRSKQWLEVTEDDVVLVQQRAFKTTRVGLKDAREIFLRGNGGGTAQIVAKGAGGTAFAALLINSDYAKGYQGEPVLSALLEGVSRNQTSSARDTAALLRQQLEHVRADGPVADAPLATFDRDWTSLSGLARGKTEPRA